ncbi:uncharacterized protein [Rutidosis leptorrhynchoides]|uniref:uncharacterized protein n=1 Tax=Rutidosis leptorrhynchoides TaxID=125765 RepID=UPI003A9A62D4
MAKLIQSTDHIVWDEAPMNDKRCFEALDRSLRDILDNNNAPLGENMRLRQPDLTPSQKVKVSDFSTWLLNIRNGEARAPDIEDPDNARWVHIPDEYCIPYDEDGLTNLIAFIYPRTSLQNPTASELHQKAIVCPKNDRADSINKIVVYMVDGPVMTYSCSDTATPYRNDGGESEMLNPVKCLNRLNYAGLPPPARAKSGNLSHFIEEP